MCKKRQKQLRPARLAWGWLVGWFGAIHLPTFQELTALLMLSHDMSDFGFRVPRESFFLPILQKLCQKYLETSATLNLAGWLAGWLAGVLQQQLWKGQARLGGG